MLDSNQIRLRLVNTLTTYDRQQSTKRHYNRHALGQYLARVDEVMQDIANGASPAAAIQAGFTESLAKKCLKACKLEPVELKPARGMCYVPASER